MTSLVVPMLAAALARPEAFPQCSSTSDQNTCSDKASQRLTILSKTTVTNQHNHTRHETCCVLTRFQLYTIHEVSWVGPSAKSRIWSNGVEKCNHDELTTKQDSVMFSSHKTVLLLQLARWQNFERQTAQLYNSQIFIYTQISILYFKTEL